MLTLPPLTRKFPYCMQAAPHVTETADKAGEAIQEAAHAVAKNAEPVVNRATFVVEKKVSGRRHHVLAGAWLSLVEPGWPQCRHGPCQLRRPRI